MVTLVRDVLLVSRYPVMSRRLPGASVIGSAHVLLLLHVAVAVVAAPSWSTSGSGVERVAPNALFQFAAATTPALSPAAMARALLPTKFRPSATGAGATTAGTKPVPGAGGPPGPPAG